MSNPLQTFWNGKLEQIKASLEENNFKVWIAQDLEETQTIFWDQVFNNLSPESVAFGGSMTVQESGIYAQLKEKQGLKVIDTYDSNISKEEMIQRRREALLTDLFITGTNAVTADGNLINLDGMGNRVAGLTFGPRHVLLLIGRNKIVYDLEQAINRIKDYSAPINTIRLNKKTPCTKTFKCEDCKSPDRICNTWAITEKSNPPERVKIILINQDIGF